MTIFGSHISRLVKPELRLLGFRPRVRSRVLYERPMERGLLEYALWVCHRDCDAFHIRCGARHALCDAVYGADHDYACMDYLGEFLYSSESELDVEIVSSLDLYRECRKRRLPAIERQLRAESERKQDLIRWHGWWKEFASAGPNVPSDLRKHFVAVPAPVIDSLFKFMTQMAKACRPKPEVVLWDCFAILKEYQDHPDLYDGKWWTLHGRVHWAGSFRKHLHDLDGLLEPYDV